MTGGAASRLLGDSVSDPALCPRCLHHEGVAVQASPDTATAHSLPISLYRCQSCGQVWTVKQSSVRDADAVQPFAPPLSPFRWAWHERLLLDSSLAHDLTGIPGRTDVRYVPKT